MSQLFSEIFDYSSPLDLNAIPILEYEAFYDQLSRFMKDEANHCLSYYGVNQSDSLRFLCSIADDKTNSIKVFSFCLKNGNMILKSLTQLCPQLHIFEREIHENYGVEFEGHPWLKPVRYPHDRNNLSVVMGTYPFYVIESEELHEVGVGPVHAGIIEPGHFRFICNGEKVLHLEIQLGYQHRGIEKLFVETGNSLQRCILSECIAGDSSVAHALAHSQLMESLTGFEVGEALQIERCIGLELERIAVHIGDTAALCGDIAYQLGQVVCEALRTEIINITQRWCGNRFGKGLVRPGGTNYPMDDQFVTKMMEVIDKVSFRYYEIADRIYSMPSVLARFENIGQVTRQQGLSIGIVGLAARTCGISRDIRSSHPFQYYKNYAVQPVLLETGDVLSRGMLRFLEVKESIKIIRELAEKWHHNVRNMSKPDYDYKLKPGSFAISLVEGWRGEICHTAITDGDGEIINYKIKDPSFHNWMALALAVRNQEISDFPVCNKSFNLSYCGNDL